MNLFEELYGIKLHWYQKELLQMMCYKKDVRRMEMKHKEIREILTKSGDNTYEQHVDADGAGTSGNRS